MSLCHKLWIYNPYFFGTQCRKSLILSYIIWSYIIHSLKYLRSTTLESKDIVFRKAEFVAKTQYLWHSFISISRYRIISSDKLSWVSINSKYAQVSSYTPFHVSFTVTLSKKQKEHIYRADNIEYILRVNKHTIVSKSNQKAN